MRKAPSAGIMTKKMIASILFLNSAGFKKNIFLEKRVFTFEHGAKVFCDSVTSFLMLAKGALLLNDSGDFDVVLFSHVVILIDFVVSVKLFSQVFCDLGRGCNLQSACVKQASLSVMMSMGLVSLVTDNAVDCVAAHPELAFLWCLVFHS